jgi:hypothetical protein
MEVLLYSTTGSGIFERSDERREIDNLSKTGTVSAYVFQPREEYTLVITPNDLPSEEDEFYFHLIDRSAEDVEEEEEVKLQSCPNRYHACRSIVLAIDDGEIRKTAKEPGKYIRWDEKLPVLYISIFTDVVNCKICDVFWLRIEWWKHGNCTFEEIAKDIPIVMGYRNAFYSHC